MSPLYVAKMYRGDFVKPEGVKTFLPQTPWIDDFAQLIVAEGCEEVNISDSWTSTDCVQLAKVRAAKYIVANPYPPVDITPLQEMHWLKGLSIGKVKLSGPFDFRKLVSLEALSVNWQPKKMVGLFEHTGLRKLLIDSYPHEDLSPLAGMTGLEFLEVRSKRALRSIRGLQRHPRLEVLQVVFGPHLELGADERLPPTIEKVEFYSCKSLARIDPLGRLPKLRDVKLDKCGHIESLAPLHHCRELTDLACYDTPSDDGDMTFLADMPKLIDLRMQWRKHFKPERSVIDAVVMRNRESCPNLPDYLQPPPAEWRPKQP
jgi:hypothetical protein